MRPAAAVAIRLLALAAPLANATSCGPAPIENEQIISGRHYTLHADPRIPICPAARREGDAFIEATAAFLGVEPPQIDYHLYHVPPGDIPGCENAGGCTFDDTILSDQWVHHHELVHPIAYRLGTPPAFLLEGLAEALGPASYGTYPDYVRLPVDRSVPLEDLLDSTVFREYWSAHGTPVYVAAADFVRYVMARFGVETIRALNRRLVYFSDALTTRQTFARITGVTIDQAIADWRASPGTFDPRPPQFTQPWECANATFAPTAVDDFSDDTVVDECGSGFSERAWDGALRAGAEFGSFDVTDEGLYWEEFTSMDTSTTMQISRCDDGSAFDPPPRVSGFMEPSRAAHLRPGRHFLALRTQFYFHQSFNGPSRETVSWRVHRVGTESPVCDNAPALPLPTPGFEFAYTARPSDWPGTIDDPLLGTLALAWLRFDVTAARTLTASSANAYRRLCTGPCSTPANCTTLVSPGAVGASIAALSGSTVWVELRAPRASTRVDVTFE